MKKIIEITPKNRVKYLLVSFVCFLVNKEILDPVLGVNSATLHIKRPSSFYGVAIRAPIYVNDRYIGKIASGDEIEWKVKPGHVTVTTSSGVANINGERQNFNRINLDAKAGKTYNISVSMPAQLEFGLPMQENAGAFELRMN